MRVWKKDDLLKAKGEEGQLEMQKYLNDPKGSYQSLPEQSTEKVLVRVYCVKVSNIQSEDIRVPHTIQSGIGNNIRVPSIIQSGIIHPLGNCNRSRIQPTLQCHHIGCITSVLLSCWWWPYNNGRGSWCPHLQSNRSFYSSASIIPQFHREGQWRLGWIVELHHTKSLQSNPDQFQKSIHKVA